MPMYALTPTFPPNFEVVPKSTVYRVASYHTSEVPSVGASNGVSQPQLETDPRKVLEKKQQELIERLKAQTEQINKLLISLGNQAPKSTPAQKSTALNNAEIKNVEGLKKSAEKTPESNAKTTKDAKKEARKAAKSEAVKKVASGEAPLSKSAKARLPVENVAPWTVEDDRKTWETDLTLTVNIPPSLVYYSQESLESATLTIREKDLNWVRALAQVGEKRGVSFAGEVKNQTKEKSSSVNVVKGSTPSLQFGKTTVKSLQTIWKLLGIALGLFSRRPGQVLSASHQAIWLGKAEQILQGADNLTFSTREASQFLARFDSLSSQWEVCVADIVFKSLLDLSQNLPNNVETWAKKIDVLVS